MIVATPTITHTGTRFLHRRIFRVPHNFKVYSPERIATRDGNAIYHVHMFDKFKKRLMEFIEWELPIVIPLVHPARNWESHTRRNRWPKQFHEQWQNMIEFCKYCDPMFLHMDDEKLRDKEAWHIIEEFNLPKCVDWTVSNESGATHGTHDLQLTDAHIAKVPQKYIDFYEQMK